MSDTIQSVNRTRFQFTPWRAAAMVYLLAAMALWWTLPPAPRAKIEAGANAWLVGFSVDGQSLLTVDQDLRRNIDDPSPEPRFIRLWNASTGEPGLAIDIGDTRFSQVGFSADGNRVFVGADYYSVESGQKLSTTHYIDAAQSGGVIESPDGRTIANSVFDTVVVDTLSGETRFQVSGGKAAAFTADGKTLAVAVDVRSGKQAFADGADQWAVKLYDAFDGTKLSTPAAGEGTVRDVAIAPRGDKLAIAVEHVIRSESNVTGIQIWDVASGQRERMLPLDTYNVSALGSLRFLADGKAIALQFWSIATLVWDWTTSPSDESFGTVNNPARTCLSADGHLAAVWHDPTQEIMVRRLGTGKRDIISRHAYSEPRARIEPKSFTSDGRLIVTVTHARDGLGVFDRLRMTLAVFFPGLARNAPVGDRVDCDVLDVSSGRRIGQVPGDRGDQLVTVSADGRTLITRVFSSELRDTFTLWDVPPATPWVAIFGWALLPAAFAGLVPYVSKQVRTRFQAVC